MKSIILNRLREPSTWAGMSALGLIFGLPPGTFESIGQIVGGLSALAAILIPETKTE